MNRRLLGLVVTACIPLTLAACGKSPSSDSAYKQLSQAIVHGQDQVGADTLADWIIKGKRDFVLLDVRPQSDFTAGHIESAQSTPLTYLVEPKTLARLPKDRKLILYSNGNRKSSQAAVMLRLAGFDAYSLLGGYQFWNERVLHPTLPANAGNDEILKFKKQQAVACYFSGNYKGGSGESGPPPSAGFTPELRPKPPARPKTGAPKIREGC
jgi:rhodanese-related sulfurtransferase